MPRTVVFLLLAVTVAGCAAAAPAATDPVETTAADSPSPSSRPTAPSAPPATPTPSPTPAPTPDPSALELRVTGCNGGAVLDWSSSTHPSFHHYVALRSPEFEIAPDWPPIAPAVDWGHTYATDRFVTSAVDASIIPSSTLWYYRVMAYDAAGEVLGASPVRSARMSPVERLAPVTVEAAGDGQMRVGWGRYGGLSSCFTAYRVLVGAAGSAGTLLGTVSDRDTTELVSRGLVPGSSVTLRVEAVHVTPLGTLVLGRTDPVTLTLPGP